MKTISVTDLPSDISAWGIALLICLGATGCNESGPSVVPVTGKVTRNGEPVPNIWVTFTPSNGRPSTGIADAEGNYRLTYNRQKKGALVGEHTVSVLFRASSMQEEQAMARGKKIHPDQDEIAQKYGPGGTEQLKITVGPSASEIDLALD